MAQGRLRRLVTRRRVKWVGTVLCVLVLGVGVASAWYGAAGWVINKPTLAVHMDISRGQAVFAVIEPDAPPKGGVRILNTIHVRPLPNPSIDLKLVLPERDRFISADSDPPFILTQASLPLWIPLLLIAAPTAWIWHTDRRAKPWQCPKCRYDLRGLYGGVCPECGGLTGRQT